MQLDPVDHFRRLAQLPDDRQRIDNFADASPQSMTVGHPRVLDPSCVHFQMIVIVREQHAALRVGMRQLNSVDSTRRPAY